MGSEMCIRDSFKMGYASAISWIIFIVIMLITLVLFATSKRWVFYGDES